MHLVERVVPNTLCLKVIPRYARQFERNALETTHSTFSIHPVPACGVGSGGALTLPFWIAAVSRHAFGRYRYSGAALAPAPDAAAEAGVPQPDAV
jgi:hypothetical protein